MSNTMEVPAQKSHSDLEELPTFTLTPARALHSPQGADCYPEVTQPLPVQLRVTSVTVVPQPVMLVPG